MRFTLRRSSRNPSGISTAASGKPQPSAEGPPDPAELLPPASLGRRIAAFGVDYLVLAAYMASLSLVFIGLGVGTVLEGGFADPPRAQLLGFVVLTAPAILYFAAWERSAHQATPGKRALGLRVLTEEGGHLPWSRSLIRSAVKFIPWELAHACLWRIPGWPGAVETIPAGVVAGFVLVWLLVILFVLSPLIDRRRRTPYDRLAGTTVVRG